MRNLVSPTSLHYSRLPQPDSPPAEAASASQSTPSTASSSPTRRRSMLSGGLNPARLAGQFKNLMKDSLPNLKIHMRGQTDRIARQLVEMTPSGSQAPDAPGVKQLASNMRKNMTKEERRSLKRNLKQLAGPENG